MAEQTKTPPATKPEQTKGQNPPPNGDKPETEKRDKAEAFRRVGVRRTTATIKALRQLAKVGNRNVYTYTPEQAEKILSALVEEVRAVQTAFRESGTAKDEIEFSL